MIKNIYFDFDGVLTLNEDAYKLMSQNIASAFDGDYQVILESFTNYRHDLALGDLQFEDCWAEFCKTTGVEISLDHFYSDIVPNLKKNDEMFALVRTLKKNGYGLGIITNNPPKRYEILAALRGIEHTFDTVSLPSEVGSLKSNKAIFAHALEQGGGIDATQAIFIDNKENNLLVPRELGFHTYHFDTYLNDIDALKTFLASQDVDVNQA